MIVASEYDETLFGPFSNIEVMSDRLRCDGADIPFAVIGDYEILEQNPPGPASDYTWNGNEYVAKPVIPPIPVPMPYDFLIDVGPFFDRFGAQQIPVLANLDAVNQAIIKTTMARKWIDLKRADLVGMLALIKSKNPGVSDELVLSILNTPVSADENMALRKVYFS